ncbi:MAG TPA: ATP-binding protein [Actinomycetota bacterium]|nr:ATP-binding protein [Actinomycetota bacterium]
MSDTDLARVIASIREAIVVLDSQGAVVEWLAGARRMFGWSAEEMAGCNLDERLQPKDVNGNRTCIGRVAKDRELVITKGTPEREVQTVTKTGAPLWIGVTSSFERGPGGALLRTTVVMRDIGRRKRVDLAKSEVISAVAHELRSPLTSVKGFASTLLRRWDRFDDDHKKHLLATINTDADRVTRLIGELLDLSRLEAGRLPLSRQMISLDDITSRVVERIKPRAENHEIGYEFPDGFPQVYADSDKVEQVLTNLLENAVKYTPGGRVRIIGTLQDSVVLVSVTDEGKGIAHEHRYQVFNKFFRERAQAQNPGTGLGLYISKGLVEAHGGRIWVENGADKGAVFCFTLPMGSEGEAS